VYCEKFHAISLDNPCPRYYHTSLMKSSHTFKGGFKFVNYRGQPQNTLIDLPIPQRVIIPLRQGSSSEVAPLVQVGDKVSAGQIIGRSDEALSSPVHSSVYGTVEDIKRMNYFKRDVTMVVIRAEDKPGFERLSGATLRWEQLSEEELERLIYLSGTSSLDRDGIPTRFKNSVILPKDVQSLIVHGVGSEPYNISLDVLLADKRLLHLIEGLRILHKTMGQAKVYLALNIHKKRMIEEARKITANYDWLEVLALEPKYPQGYDEMLVPTILNKRFPYGYSAANIGIIVLNVQAVLAVYDAVCEGKPLIDRIIALCGTGLKENLHVRARVGTPLSDIIQSRLDEKRPSRIVLNSALTGAALNDLSLPLDRTYSQLISIPEGNRRELLVFMRPGPRRDSYSRTFISALVPWVPKYCNTNMHGERRPCITCNYCEEVCPVSIIPHLLSKYVRAGMADETLTNFKIFNCIECGLCSFVCPSKIPLANDIKEGQEKLIMLGCDRTQCILPYFDLKGIESYRGAKEIK